MTEWKDPAYAMIESNGGEGLPHRDDDPIMRLSAHYNEPAKFMREQFAILDKRAETETGLSRSQVMERRYFMMSWLAGLYVTMEGIEGLSLKDALESRPGGMSHIIDRIPPLLVAFTLHRSPLRLLRNAQYHYQPTASKHRQFFENEDRLNWAGYIQDQADRIFSEYRVQCAVICAVAGRKDEIDMGNRPHWAGRLQFIRP